MQLNYILIPLFTVLVSGVGSYFTSASLLSWYKTIKLSSFTPPGSVIGAVWTVLFILATISALIVWNKFSHDNYFWIIITAFIVNGILNVLWSYLFFYLHITGWVTIEAAILALSVILLVVLIWPLSKLASSLLIPYAAWASFATFLTYSVYSLNK